MKSKIRDRIRLAQLFLRDEDYYEGEIDGWWGAKSEKAWLGYQGGLKEDLGKPWYGGGDMYTQTQMLSPNKGGSFQPEGFLFHHAVGTWEGTKSWITQRKSRVSYHVLINMDGERVEFVPPDQRAWHAGKSHFKGRGHCNAFMVGISFIGDTNTGKYRNRRKSLTPAEIKSAIEYMEPLVELYDIPLSNMTHHRVVSPGRKNDLNPNTWNQLFKELKKEF